MRVIARSGAAGGAGASPPYRECQRRR